MRVGIIGGGIAGLTAAYELSKAGHKVLLFDGDDELGGQVRTFTVGGARLERLYHHIFTSDVDIISLIEELDLGSRMLWMDSKVGLYRDGRVYDFVTPIDLLRFRPLGIIDRVRLGLVSLYLRRYENWRALEGVMARDWVVKYGGKRSYDAIWGPMLKNKFGSYSDKVGMVWLWGKLHLRLSSRQGEKERLGYMCGSFGLLIDALRDRIVAAGGEIYTSTPVDKVDVENGRASGIEAGGRVHPCDAVIAAVPSDVFLGIAPGLPPEYASKVMSAKYLGAVVLVLTLNRSMSRFYWMNISDADFPFVAVIEHTNFVDPSAYGGRHVVYISNYLPTDSRMYSMSVEQLLSEYWPHIKEIAPDFNVGWIVDKEVFRAEAAQPIIGTNYSSRIPEHATPVGGLFLANSTQIYPEDRGMNYSVRLGRDVARLVGGDE
ncbi:MAG: NAD(P)/FAD-dependent oxidoreductase [Chloroflexota bacterium]|nr:NAD(P)/FAD-dependent oxidoreductase [Chloroflexota bacterium]